MRERVIGKTYQNAAVIASRQFAPRRTSAYRCEAFADHVAHRRLRPSGGMFPKRTGMGRSLKSTPKSTRKPGTYSLHCCNRCGIGHGGMKGQLIVEP
jgi:hypothetical protein